MNHLDPYGYLIPEIFPGGFSPEYQAIYDAFITKPPDAVAENQDQMVRGMIADGDWQTKDIFYVTAAQSAADSLINWINPGTHDLTVVNLLAGAFTVNRGWTGNGVNGYLNTNYNPNTDGVNYLQDDASIGCYIRTNVLAENMYDIGTYDGANASFLKTNNNDRIYTAINDINLANFVAGNIDSRGFYITSRLLAANFNVYKNKIVTNFVENSTGIPSFNFYIFSINNSGAPLTYSTKQVSAAFAGGGMTQVNVNNFTDRLETFLDSIGAGVIP